ncbi:Hypothetical predicted protein [Mytilus galloprovincialis]|uniref:Uncharacterized protein n=1 Tax=Mytilus galloprovincialis TaxID=29158 RepID=A0A8B6GZI3_MYTGA|nr:Hypothetical predicted protein [Mytilus galloprovincialis]
MATKVPPFEARERNNTKEPTFRLIAGTPTASYQKKSIIIHRKFWKMTYIYNIPFLYNTHIATWREFPNIKHSFDIWHGAKKLGKKIIKAGQEKEKKCLLEWTRDIVNHFWYSADVSKSIQEFMGVWCGMIHHVVNEHEWSMSYTDDGTYACKHGPLCAEREKGWLKAGSPAHDAAIGIVMDKRFIKKIPYNLNCRSTAELENFQNLILKYASKRHSVNPVSYRACNLEDKDYHHVPTIIKTIVENRLQHPVGMNRKVLLDVNDPRRVSAVLAPTLPPSTADLIELKISRFNKEDQEKTRLQLD